MSTITWKTGVSADWSVGADWIGGVVPKATDTALLTGAGRYTVTVASAPETVGAITLNTAGGTLSVSNSLAVAGLLALNSGTLLLNGGGIISGATIAETSGVLFSNSGTLSSVTVRGALSFNQNPVSTLVLANSVKFTDASGGTGPGQLNIGFNDTVDLAASSSSATETLANATVNLAGMLQATQGTVALGSTLIVQAVGRSASIVVDSGASIVNSGLISGAVAGGVFQIGGPGSFNNNGTIAAGNGELMMVSVGSLTNTGKITATSGATLDLFISAWPGGTISETNATLNFFGNLTTAQLNTVQASGGTVGIDGTLTNTGGTLSIGTGATLTRLALDGTIKGGTVKDGGGGLVAAGGTLDGVSYVGTLDLSAGATAQAPTTGATLFIADGLTVGTILLTGAANQLIFVGNGQTLNSTTINLGNSLKTTPNTSSVIPGATLEQGIGNADASFNLTLASTVKIQQTGLVAEIDANGTIFDNANITAGLAGGTLTIGHGYATQGSFVNAGTIAVSNGELLDITVGNLTNSRLIAATGGATVDVAATTWTDTSTGTISETGSSLYLWGNLAAGDLAHIKTSGGTLGIEGSLDLANGTLTVGNGAGTNAARLSLGGTLADAVVKDTGSGLVATGGTLNNVAWWGTLDLSAGATVQSPGASQTLSVGAGGLTLKGATGTGAGAILLTGAGNVLNFYGTQTLDNATISLGNSTDPNAYSAAIPAATLSQADPSATLTFGPALVIQQTGLVAAIDVDGTIDNEGSIAAGVAGGTLGIDNGSYYYSGVFLNNGTLAASNGDTLTIGVSEFDNAGVLSAASGATVNLNAAAWTNSGSISETNATLNLAGLLTAAQLAQIQLSGGTLGILGTLDNSAGTLAIGSGTGQTRLVLSGTIANGVVKDAGSGLVAANGTLDGVTWQGSLDLGGQPAETLTIVDGLTVTALNGSTPGTILLTGAGDQLTFVGTETLDNAAVSIGNATLGQGYYDSTSVLTLGAKLAVQFTGSAGYISGPGTIVNLGSIAASNSAGVDGIGNWYGNSFVNAGTIAVSNGATLALTDGSFANTGLVSVTTGGVLQLSETWANTGTISETGGTINIAGNLTIAHLTPLVRSGGLLVLGGLLDNTGGTLNIGANSSATSRLSLSGEILNGAVHDSGSGLIAANGTLAHVTWQGTLDLSGNAAGNAETLTITNGLTATGLTGTGAGTVLVTGAGNMLILTGSQTLDNASVSLGNSNTLSAYYGNYVPDATLGQSYSDAAATLTLGPKLSILHAGIAGAINVQGTVINQGTITANLSGGTLAIEPVPYYYGTSSFVNAGTLAASNGDTVTISTNSFSNTGTLSAAGGAVLNLQPVSWTNTGTIKETGATINLYNTVTAAQVTPIVRSGGTLGLYGMLNNAGGTLAIGANSTTTSLLYLANTGTVSGGFVQDAGQGLVAAGGTLDGVTWHGTLDLSIGAGSTAQSVAQSLYIKDGLTATGSTGSGAGTILLTGGNNQLIFVGSQTLDNASVSIGSAAMAQAGSALRAYSIFGGGGDTITQGYSDTASTLVLGPHLTITHTGAAATISPVGTIVNQGSIVAGLSGGSLLIGGGYSYGNTDQFTNANVLAASNGDTVTISAGSFSNTGSVTVTTAATLDLSTANWSNTGGISETNATINLYDVVTAAQVATLTRSGGTLGLYGTLNNTGGTLTIGANSTTTSLLYLDGTVSGGVVKDTGQGLVAANGTLDGVTYRGTLDLSAGATAAAPNASQTLTVTDGLTLFGIAGTGAGTVKLTGASNEMIFVGTQTLDTATVLLGNATKVSTSTGFPFVPNATLTQGNQDGASTLTLGSHLAIVQSGAFGEIAAVGTIVNKGTITAALSGALLTITNGTQSYGGPTLTPSTFINVGSIAIGNGGTVTFADTNTYDGSSLTFTNQGSIAITSGGVLNLEDALWTNTGTISETGGTINLYGTVTVGQMGVMKGSGGTIALLGTLNNTGTTLNIGTGSNLGTLTLEGSYYGGTIKNGIVHDGGAGLAVASSGTLDGVTWQGTLDLGKVTGATLTVVDGLTLRNSAGTGAGQLNLTGANDTLEVVGTATTLNGATINVGNASTTRLDIGSSGGTLTFGSGLTIQHTGADAEIGGYGTIVNQGVITAALYNGYLTIGSGSSYNPQGTGPSDPEGTAPSMFSSTLVNTGTIAASNGDHVSIVSSTFTNSGVVTATSGAILAIGDFGTTWSNTGTISETAATLRLFGDFATAQLNTVTRAGGIVDIAGTMENAGTLNVGTGTALGTVKLTGTIDGGTIHDAGGGIDLTGYAVGVTNSSSANAVLDGVTYLGTLDLSRAQAEVTIRDGITLAGTGGAGTAGQINLTGSDSELWVQDGGTLANATVFIGDADPAGSFLGMDNTTGLGGTLTLASTLNMVQTGLYARLTGDRNLNDAIVNNGSIAATASGGLFSVYGGSFTNNGSITVGNGDAFRIETDTFTNVASGGWTGGTYAVGAGSVLQLANNDSVATLGANLTLSGSGAQIDWLNSATGALVSLNATLTLISSNGQLHLLAGSNFATSAGFGIHGLLELGGGTLSVGSLSIANINGGVLGTLVGYGTVNGAVWNLGLVEAKGGTLKIANALTGTGALHIDAGATLELGGTAVSTETATFAAATGVLKLDAVGATAASNVTVAGFVLGDTIDLAKIVTSVSFSNHVLTAYDGSTAVAALTLTGSYTTANFSLAADGHGGTDILDPPVSTKTIALGGARFSNSAAAPTGSDGASAMVVSAGAPHDGGSGVPPVRFDLALSTALESMAKTLPGLVGNGVAWQSDDTLAAAGGGAAALLAFQQPGNSLGDYLAARHAAG
jgi:hypothetical protein